MVCMNLMITKTIFFIYNFHLSRSFHQRAYKYIKSSSFSQKQLENYHINYESECFFEFIIMSTRLLRRIFSHIYDTYLVLVFSPGKMSQSR
jgi:hypothetical protein